MKSGDKPDRYIVIGKILAAHGLDGGVKVLPLTDFPERFDGLRRVFLFPELSHSSEIEEAGAVEAIPLTIRGVRPQQKHMLLYFEGISNRSAAEELGKSLIGVLREEAFALPEDTYYLSDLIGFAVYTPDGCLIGTVSHVIPSAQDLLEIETPGGRIVMVPFVKELVPRVDTAARSLLVEPLTGLLDL